MIYSPYGWLSLSLLSTNSYLLRLQHLTSVTFPSCLKTKESQWGVFSKFILSLFAWQVFAELNYLLLRSVNMKFDTRNKQVPLMYLCSMPIPVNYSEVVSNKIIQEMYQISWNNHVFIAGGQMATRNGLEATKQLWRSQEQHSQPQRRGMSWSWFVDFQGFTFEKIFATDFWLTFLPKKDNCV